MPRRPAVTRRAALALPLAAAAAAAAAAHAQTGVAPEVDLALALAVDVSRSIDDEEAKLQRQGYVDALRDERIRGAVGAGKRGRIALCYIEWAGTQYQAVVIDWTIVDSAAALEGFAAKLEEAPRESHSWTAVGTALLTAGNKLRTAPVRADRRVIDVSGDGRNNDGVLPETMRDRLAAEGITINGLPVMMDRNNFGRPPDRELDRYYEENVIGGPGHFMIVARTFDDFSKAIRSKLAREIAGLHGPVVSFA